MSKFYDDIMESLNEALDYVDSKKDLKKNTVVIVPVKEYTADEVKSIRKSTGMSQKLFAKYMGVSGKTVEAWEEGVNHPSGSSSRILSMIETDKGVVNEFPFVKIEA